MKKISHVSRVQLFFACFIRSLIWIDTALSENLPWGDNYFIIIWVLSPLKALLGFWRVESDTMESEGEGISGTNTTEVNFLSCAEILWLSNFLYFFNLDSKLRFCRKWVPKRFTNAIPADELVTLFSCQKFHVYTCFIIQLNSFSHGFRSKYQQKKTDFRNNK